MRNVKEKKIKQILSLTISLPLNNFGLLSCSVFGVVLITIEYQTQVYIILKIEGKNSFSST